MPKLLLKRRHRRENDLSLLHQCCVESSPCWQKTSPRMVSEEDMQGSGTTETLNGAASVVDMPECAVAADATAANTLKRRNSQLKRPVSSMCLPDLENNISAATQETAYLSSPLPRPLDASTTGDISCLLSPESPWGQFVEMTAPSPEYPSPGGDYIPSDDYSPASYPLSSSSQFLSFCLHPEDNHRALLDPYPSGKHELLNAKRRRLPSTRLSESSSFLLHVPTRSDPMLEEAEGALRGLSF